MFPTAVATIPAATSVVSSSRSSIRSLDSSSTSNANKELQLKNLNKLVGSCLKSLKYMEQIVSKRKYEILPIAATHLIESLLDVYNLVKTFKLNTNSLKTMQFVHHRDMFHSINVALAKLVKWCDEQYDNNNTNDDVERANELNKSLTECLLQLVEALKNNYFLNQNQAQAAINEANIKQEVDQKAINSTNFTSSQSHTPTKTTNSTNNLKAPSSLYLSTSSSSSSSSSTKSSYSSSNSASTTTTTKILNSQASPSTTITQTSTLTITRSGGGSDNSRCRVANEDQHCLEDDLISINKMLAFSDLDKLALELSELSSNKTTTTNSNLPQSSLNNTASNTTTTPITSLKSISNQQCNYLLTQFESFAKQFTNTPFSSSSPSSSSSLSSSSYSTLKSTNNINNSLASTPIKVQGITLHKYSAFNHDLVDKNSHINAIGNKINNKEEILSKDLCENTLKKTKFKQKSIAFNNLEMASKLLLTDNKSNSSNALVNDYMTLLNDNVCKKEDLIDSNHKVSQLENESKEKLTSEDFIRPRNCFDFDESQLTPKFLHIDDDDDDFEGYEYNNIGDESQTETDLDEKDENNKTKQNNDEAENITDKTNENTNNNLVLMPPLVLDEDHNLSKSSSSRSLSISLSFTSSSTSSSSSICESLESLTAKSNTQPQEQTSNFIKTNILGLLDVHSILEYQHETTTNSNSNTKSILRGGDVDALIVLATSANASVHAATHPIKQACKVSGGLSSSSELNLDDTAALNKVNFLYQEAFLTTYRTILEPFELVNKLILRYRIFTNNNNKSKINVNTGVNVRENDAFDEELNIKNDEKFDLNRLRLLNKQTKLSASAARNSLTLLIRVVDDLEGIDLDEKMKNLLTNFVFELLVDDELQMARLLRKKLLNKRCENLKSQSPTASSIQTQAIKTTNNSFANTIAQTLIRQKSNQTLLDFKSMDLAEQMCLIDINLFTNISLSEILLYSTKQNEKSCPNLTRFTQHFNNISYWARSRILEPITLKERERYLLKFLKIMKHLRKMNNFNSYLAILSAVDSGPIQRLDWPKYIIDTIKDYSHLIDPKCGFKYLREAVSESNPPCIPHIGLILQDLTILHIANSDHLPSGNCNFWKRWQQFNILERVRCFRRSHYSFKFDLKIQTFFNNFNDYMNEDAQYVLSEKLKPRLNK